MDTTFRVGDKFDANGQECTVWLVYKSEDHEKMEVVWYTCLNSGLQCMDAYKEYNLTENYELDKARRKRQIKT